MMAGGFLKVLGIAASVIGGLAVLLVIPEGLTADGGIGVIFLWGGSALLIISPIIWAAGKALEFLSRIEINTRKNQ